MFQTSESCKVADVAEAKTGTAFPGTFCHLKKRDCPSIVGVGARAKRLLGVKNVDGAKVAVMAELGHLEIFRKRAACLQVCILHSSNLWNFDRCSEQHAVVQSRLSCVAKDVPLRIGMQATHFIHC